jgi:hypothetical protein
VSLERVLAPPIRASLWDAGAIRNELQPIPSLRAMKNDDESMTLTRPHAADAVAQIDVIGPRDRSRSVLPERQGNR